MNIKVFLLAFFVSAVICKDSSEEDSQSSSSDQRIYNNGQPLTIPQLLQISNFNQGYTTASPLLIQNHQNSGQYNPTTASPLLIQNNQNSGQYNPTTATPLYIQNHQNSGQYNPTTATPLYIQTQQGNSYNPTTSSPLYIQSQQPTGSYNPTSANPLYVQQSQGQQPIQVIQIPTQTQKPNNIYVQTQPQNQAQQPQVVVIPNKKPNKPNRPNKRPTTTVQPPSYVQTQQPVHTQTPVQVIQVTGKPSTVSPPIFIQTQQPQNQGHHGHQVVNVEPQQEIYQIYPGQLENPTDYEFNWFVNNQESGDYKSHREVRQNDIVQGQYEVLDPDGYRRIVTYTADEVHGFRAVVRRIPLNNSQRPFNDYFGVGSTTRRPFGSRGKKHASIVPLENSSAESGSHEEQ